ncbi:variable large family protein [Borrelia parkeri]|nr:variable large family protein [Borrelia parkeri]
MVQERSDAAIPKDATLAGGIALRAVAKEGKCCRY